MASCRVLEKAGFQYEGTLRSNAVKNGNVLYENVFFAEIRNVIGYHISYKLFFA